MADDDRLDALVAEADALLDIEQEAADHAAATLRRRLVELNEALTAAWVKLYGSVTARATKSLDALGRLLADLLARLRRALAAAVPVARSAILAGALAAAQHGVDTAVDAFPASFDVKAVTAAQYARTGREDDVAAIVKAGRDRAAALLVPDYATTLTKALTALGAGGERTATELERAARTAANEAATAAARAVAAENGVGLLWVAERDACVHCLAYAGRTVEPGKLFPNDLTYGDKPLDQPDERSKGLDGPPLHPNCRCTVRPYSTEWDSDLPRALEREARRSVALGFKLDSESDAVRLRAADRLLKAGAGLPKTVEQRARSAVKQGRFADRRRPANR
ncbi:MAG TPA: hypothetical protein VM430_18900 [Microbacterium sp.]|nr:hypothetical protein [Microbacterium sp.]